MFLTKATMAGGKLVNIKTDAVALIEKVRELLSQQSGKDTSLGEALLEIYRSRSGPEERQALVNAAIAQLNLDRDEIFERLDKLESYLVEVIAPVEKSLLPLSSAAKLELPLTFEPATRNLDVGQVAFSLGGEIESALVVQSFVAGQPPDQWVGPIAAGAAIQSLSLSGKIGFRGSASGAFGGGGLRFSSAMSSSGQINLYHQYAEATPRIVALVNSSQEWAFAWDLEALAEKLKPVRADGSIVGAGFRRVQVQGNGAIALAGGVTIGRVLSYEGSVGTPAGENTIGAEAKLGATLDFSLTRNGSFGYQIEKDKDGFVTIDLVKKAGINIDSSIDLGADIQVAGLDSVARPYLAKFFEDPADLLKELDEWTKPGDRLVEALSATDWQQPVVGQIAQLLLGQVDTQQVTDPVIGKLEEKLQQQLNEKIPFWGETSADIANELIETISERLDLDADLRNKLVEQLKPRLQQRIGDVQARFEKRITGLTAQAGSNLDNFLKPFESVGENVQSLKDRVNNQATDIVEPAIRLLKRYQDLRNRLIAGLEKVAQFKIGMAYAARLSRGHGDDSLLSFRVREVNDTTKAVHRAFLLGRINSVWAEFRRATDQNWIDNVSGRFGSFSNYQSVVSFSLHFGDVGISMTRVKASDVDVQVSPGGSVLVATNRISQENVVKAFNVQRTIGFTGTYDLAVAARDPNAFPTPLGFNIGYQDDNLQTKELEQFLASLEQGAGGRSLLSVGAASNAVKKFNALSALHGTSAKARIDVALPVGRDDLVRLIGIPDEKIKNRAVDLSIELMIRGRERTLLTELANGKGLDKREIAFIAAGTTSAGAMRKLELRDSESLHQALIRRLRKIVSDAEGLVSAVNGIRGIAEVQREIAALPGNPRALSQGSAKAQADAIDKRLAALDKQINDGLDDWLKARGPISGIFTESLPASTIALLALIAELSGEDTKLIPIVNVSGTGGGQIAVV